MANGDQSRLQVETRDAAEPMFAYIGPDWADVWRHLADFGFQPRSKLTTRCMGAWAEVYPLRDFGAADQGGPRSRRLRHSLQSGDRPEWTPTGLMMADRVTKRTPFEGPLVEALGRPQWRKRADEWRARPQRNNGVAGAQTKAIRVELRLLVAPTLAMPCAT